MEEEVDGLKIEIYGNVSEQTYNEQQKLFYLVGKYE
jgi:hypothetical protein